jgi:hypothetical protein
MGITINSADVIAGLALLVAAYAALTTSKFNTRQKSLIESQEKLNALLLEKEKNEAVDDKKADLGASFIKLGSSNYRLKIWNKGKAPARNVLVDFPDGNEVVIQSEVDDKFPLEFLDKLQSVELIAAVAMNTKRKHTVRLIWSDDFKAKNEKIVYPTI